MPRLSELLRNQVTIVVPYRNTVLTVSYKPESVTAELRGKISERIFKGELRQDQYDAAFLAEVLTTWDLTGDDDAPLPLTFEVVDARSSSMQGALARAVLEDQQNPQSGQTHASS
jgi:porphobilinogen deaminase